MNETDKLVDTKNEVRRYKDIIGLSRPLSKTRVPMSRRDRAAQFAPFAALTGHAAITQEAARLTDARVELDEDAKKELNKVLQQIREHMEMQPKITVTYFMPDKKKEGGVYVAHTGKAKKIHEDKRLLVMVDGVEVFLDEVIGLEWEGL